MIRYLFIFLALSCSCKAQLDLSPVLYGYLNSCTIFTAGSEIYKFDGKNLSCLKRVNYEPVFISGDGIGYLLDSIDQRYLVYLDDLMGSERVEVSNEVYNFVYDKKNSLFYYSEGETPSVILVQDIKGKIDTISSIGCYENLYLSDTLFVFAENVDNKCNLVFCVNGKIIGRIHTDFTEIHGFDLDKDLVHGIISYSGIYGVLKLSNMSYSRFRSIDKRSDYFSAIYGADLILYKASHGLEIIQRFQYLKMSD